MKDLYEKTNAAIEKQLELLNNGDISDAERENAIRAIDALTRLRVALKED